MHADTLAFMLLDRDWLSKLSTLGEAAAAYALGSSHSAAVPYVPADAEEDYIEAVCDADILPESSHKHAAAGASVPTADTL